MAQSNTESQDKDTRAHANSLGQTPESGWKQDATEAGASPSSSDAPTPSSGTVEAQVATNAVPTPDSGGETASTEANADAEMAARERDGTPPSR